MLFDSPPTLDRASRALTFEKIRCAIIERIIANGMPGETSYVGGQEKTLYRYLDRRGKEGTC